MSTTSSNIINVYGYVKFTDTQNGIHPAVGMKVTLYDEDLFGIRQTLAVTYTSSTGLYWFSVENDTSIFENGYDIIVEIKLMNDQVQVQDLFQVHEYEYGPYQNVTTPYTYISHTFQNDELGEAVNLYQAALLGFEYVEQVDNEDINDYAYLGIEYPYGETTCWYNPLTADIYIGSDGIDNYMWDTLLHEFGHYVADQNDFTGFWPASHGCEMNLIHEFGKTIGMILAWSEGWAHYFSVISQLETNASSLNIPNVGDTDKGTYDLENVNNSGYLMGEGNEYVIAMLLYDIADLNDDGADDIDWGDDVLFDYLETVVEDIHNIDPSHHLEYFCDFYNTLNIMPYDTEFGPLMTYYKISVELLGPSYVSYECPTFSWNPQGGITYNINNDFTLYIMSSTGNQILSPIYVGNMTSYTLSVSQWNTVLAYGTSSIKWNVSAKQTDGIDTGPYYAERLSCNMPTQTTLINFHEISGNIPFAGYYKWYKFTAISTGIYTFESSGFTDTYAEFFNKPVAATSISGRLYYDNDSGVGLNFSKNVSMYQGQTIYLRVRGDGWTETGSYYIEVTGGFGGFELFQF
ncbi:MAG: hypothetical protein JEZ05_10995 [Tenericutes bacterium]|nr:hypothetical protein [Mycoplasmatota bacterium]